MTHDRDRVSAFPHFISLASGVLAGAGLMYLLDPLAGRTRRAHARDKLLSWSNDAAEGVSKSAIYAKDRAMGLLAEGRAALTEAAPTDDQLVARVRSAMGRAVSNTKAIHVDAHDGQVRLHGHILADELPDLLAVVHKVRGVKGVENQLQTHATPDLPSLQGRSHKSDGLAPTANTAARVAINAAGMGLALWGMLRRDLVGAGLGLLGAGLAAGSYSGKRTLAQSTGIGAGRRAVDIHKTIFIEATLEDVFEFFTNYENWPKFMSNVLEVKIGANDHSYWKVAGPAGTTVNWEAEVTKFVPNHVLAWKSVPGSIVATEGKLSFTGTPNGTRVDIRLGYTPPAGAIGHAVAKLFGADAKSEMDADLLRAKSFLETGKPAHDAAQKV